MTATKPSTDEFVRPQRVSPVRPRDRQRIALQIPNPEKGRHYRWASIDPGHPQSWSRYFSEGWEIVPAKMAEKLGLYGFVDKISGDQVVIDVNNAIRFGNTILLDCSDECWVDHVAFKREGWDDIEYALKTQAEEEIASIQEEYARRQRGS